MNTFVIVFAAALACVSAGGLLALPSARIIQGPSSRSTIVGPDGSAILAAAPGGRIVTEETVGVVAHAAPVVAPVPALLAGRSTLIAGPSGIIARSEPLLAAPLAYSVW